MRKWIFNPVVFAGLSSLCLAPLADGAPGYDIYPIAPLPGDSLSIATGISQNGTYVTGYSQNNSGSQAFLYNTANGSMATGSQAGLLNLTTGTTSPPVPWGQPYSVSNTGLIWGTSGIGAELQGTPTVWKPVTTSGVTTLQSFNLYPPALSNAGQVYGSNNNGVAVGAVGSQSGGLNAAAVFHFDPSQATTNPTSRTYNYASNISNMLTPNGGNLTTAFAINDSDLVVGVANDPNNAALYVPYLLDLDAGTVSIIPTSSADFNGSIPFALSDSGLVTGSEGFYGSNGQPFIYNSNTNTTIQLPLVHGSGGGSGRSINDSGEVVGTQSGQYALPFLYDGTNSYLLSDLLANNTSGAWHLSDNTSSSAAAIADNGDIIGRAYYNGVLTAYVAVPTGTIVTTPRELTFNNAGGIGDGTTWDTTQQNFNDGSGAVSFSNSPADYVTFDDNNNGHYTVTIPTTVLPNTTTFNNSNGNYVVNGPGGIGGYGNLTKLGSGTLTLNTINTYTGTTDAFAGTLILGVNGALPTGTSLDISGNGSSVVVKSLGTAYALSLGTLGISDEDYLDLQDNDLIVHGGNLANIFSYVKTGFNGGAWNGTANNSGGIISTLAGPAHPLMALGILTNDNGSGAPLYGSGGSIAATFGGATPVDGDVLVKYTYYGDANLDGHVDGSDYTRIDAAFIADQAYFAANPAGTAPPSTGWYNGDFNYDGHVDGSDYTLIDNAFNSQGASIAGIVANSTAQIAGSSVPEPASLTLLGIAGAGMLRRRRRGL